MPLPTPILRRNVLVFHAGALGDFVVTFPIAMALSRLLAQSRVVYVTQPGKGKLAEHAIGCEWRDEGAYAGLFAKGASLTDAARRSLSAASHVISFVSDGTDAWAQQAREVAPEAVYVFISPRPKSPIDDVHIAEYHRNQLTTWPGLRDGAEQMQRHIATRGLSPRGGDVEAGVVRIHPGAGGEAKRWPAAKFVALATLLAKKGLSPRFVVGEVEREKMSKQDVDAIVGAAPVDEPADFVQLYDLLRRSTAFVGNDSGPGHLAAMGGTPTVTLFGPASTPAMWTPTGPRVVPVIGSSLDAIEVDEVARKVIEAIG